MDRDKPQAKDSPGPLGTHPVGTAVGGLTGAVTGGAIAVSAGGPVGAALGVAVGAAIGSAGGKLIADVVDPQMEKEFWRRHDLWPGHEPGADLEAMQRAHDLAEPEPGDDSR